MSKGKSSTAADAIAAIFKKHGKKIIAIIIIIALLAGAVVFIVKRKNKTSETQQAAVSTVTRGDVELTITGSAAVEPYERYEIIPLVNGKITSSPYEVGDSVAEGDVLYTFDMSDIELSMQKQENSMLKSEISRTESQKDLDKLTVTAPCNGIISGMNINAGDELSNNADVAKIADTQHMKAEIPFNSEQIKNISEGQTAVLSSSAHMSSVNGKVTHISNSAAAQDDGSILYTVEVEFDNPGSFTEGTRLGAEINGMISPGGGTAQCSSTGSVKTETDGTVTSVKHKNGDYVSKGDVILTMSNDTITNSIRRSEIEYNDAQLSLKEQRQKLDDYIITSPINGTVITKNSKAGDTIDKTNSSVTMMVVADVSKLKFSLEIDELDVGLVSVGQEVDITCDAAEGESFKGEITEMSMEGTATNGVTTYTATVTINDPGSLKPSMNVDATVIIESAENVLRVPSTDIKIAQGRSYVFLKDSGKASSKTVGKKNDDISEASDEKRQPMPSGMPEGGEEVHRGENREGRGPRTDTDKTEQSRSDNASPTGVPNDESKSDGMNGDEGRAARMPQAPDGFTTVEIQVGIEGDEYTEVKSGLSEGDQIYQQSTSSSSNNMMMGGMNGMPGGGMPGGDPGGAPGGGGNRGGMGGGPR